MSIVISQSIGLGAALFGRGVASLPVRLGRKLYNESALANQIAQNRGLNKEIGVYETPAPGWFHWMAHGCGILPGKAGITVDTRFNYLNENAK